jgi:steroid 5-alpha reductase family enzyme
MSEWTIWLQGLLVLLACNTVLWAWSVRIRNASIVDIWWGLGFVVLGWSYAHWQPATVPRNLVVLVAVTVWGFRLATHLAVRNWGKGEDYRYQQFRKQYGPERYWWVSFFQVFVLQGVLAWVISLPLLGVTFSKTEWHTLDTVALVLFAVGLFFEAVGDVQLAHFKQNPANRGKLLTTGLWKYTRHPNYFGDAVVWWAFGLWAVSAGGWWALIGPALMNFLLLRVSGVAMLERTLTKTKPGFEQYVRETPAFFPRLFPKRHG